MALQQSDADAGLRCKSCSPWHWRNGDKSVFVTAMELSIKTSDLWTSVAVYLNKGLFEDGKSCARWLGLCFLRNYWMTLLQKNQKPKTKKAKSLIGSNCYESHKNLMSIQLHLIGYSYSKVIVFIKILCPLTKIAALMIVILCTDKAGRYVIFYITYQNQNMKGQQSGHWPVAASWRNGGCNWLFI